MQDSFIIFIDITSNALILSAILCLIAFFALKNFDDKSKEEQEFATATYHFANITFHIAILMAMTCFLFAYYT